MSLLRKLLQLSPRELWILGQVSVLLILGEVSLRIWSLQTMLRVLQQRCARTQVSAKVSRAPDELRSFTRFIDIADRYGLLRPSCLRKSLVLAWCLSGRGIATALTIGVARAEGQLRAHAWLEGEAGTPLTSTAADAEFLTLGRLPCFTQDKKSERDAHETASGRTMSHLLRGERTG